jgi:hypothetical protein
MTFLKGFLDHEDLEFDYGFMPDALPFVEIIGASEAHKAFLGAKRSRKGFEVNIGK